MTRQIGAQTKQGITISECQSTEKAAIKYGQLLDNGSRESAVPNTATTCLLSSVYLVVSVHNSDFMHIIVMNGIN